MFSPQSRQGFSNTCSTVMSVDGTPLAISLSARGGPKVSHGRHHGSLATEI
jgi:hypothetical protein